MSQVLTEQWVINLGYKAALAEMVILNDVLGGVKASGGKAMFFG